MLHEWQDNAPFRTGFHGWDYGRRRHRRRTGLEADEAPPIVPVASASHALWPPVAFASAAFDMGRQRCRAFYFHTVKKVLEEVSILPSRHHQGGAMVLTIYPGHGDRRCRILDTLLLDGSLVPHQGRVSRGRRRGTLTTINGGTITL